MYIQILTYMFIHVYMQSCIHTDTVRQYTRTCSSSSVHFNIQTARTCSSSSVHLNIQMATSARIYTRAHAHTNTPTYPSIHTWNSDLVHATMQTAVLADGYISIHIHTQTHIHTHQPTHAPHLEQRLSACNHADGSLSIPVGHGEVAIVLVVFNEPLAS